MTLYNWIFFYFLFFKSPSTLQSVRRHSAIVFVDHKRWRVEIYCNLPRTTVQLSGRLLMMGIISYFE